MKKKQKLTVFDERKGMLMSPGKVSAMCFLTTLWKASQDHDVFFREFGLASSFPDHDELYEAFKKAVRVESHVCDNGSNATWVFVDFFERGQRQPFMKLDVTFHPNGDVLKTNRMDTTTQEKE